MRTNHQTRRRVIDVERAMRAGIANESPSPHLRGRILEQVHQPPTVARRGLPRLTVSLAAATLTLLVGVTWLVVSRPAHRQSNATEIRASIRTVVSSIARLDDRVTLRVSRGIASLMEGSVGPGRWAIGEARQAEQRTRAAIDAFGRALAPATPQATPDPADRESPGAPDAPVSGNGQ